MGAENQGVTKVAGFEVTRYNSLAGDIAAQRTMKSEDLKWFRENEERLYPIANRLTRTGIAGIAEERTESSTDTLLSGPLSLADPLGGRSYEEIQNEVTEGIRAYHEPMLTTFAEDADVKIIVRDEEGKPFRNFQEWADHATAVSAARRQAEYTALDAKLKDDPFIQTLDEMRKVCLAKRSDYADSTDDPFRNFRLSEMSGIPAFDGAWTRLGDKFIRVCNLRVKSKRGESPAVNESMDDTLLDLANYAIICRILLRQEREKNGSK